MVIRDGGEGCHKRGGIRVRQEGGGVGRKRDERVCEKDEGGRRARE